MSRILEKDKLTDNTWRFRVNAPLIAKRRKAGQFVVLRLWEGGERFPLTIADADAVEGSITLIVQAVGKSTRMMSELEVGDDILDLVGPLGRPTHIERFGTVVMVGGGIGIAPIYPIAEAMKSAGNRVISILGARSKELLILEREMSEVSDEIMVVTDDGSYGTQGLVTGALQKLIDSGNAIDLVLAVGPPIMMQAVSELTRPYGVKTIVSLNTIMIDGTGMCGGCRIRYDGQNRFVCVDGPEFEGHKVDFTSMVKRQQAYGDAEKASLEYWEKPDHKFAEVGCTFHRAASFQCSEQCDGKRGGVVLHEHVA
jgi:ferredoxin--NADP+ reductase